MPVEAPEGTAARPHVPSARTTSTSTVGLPREFEDFLPSDLFNYCFHNQLHF